MSDENDLVELTVDADACIGSGQCELLAPEIFEVDGDTGMASVIGDGRLPRAKALDLADRCPSRAINLGA